MKLLHLTAVGPGVPSAGLDFDTRLTVIYGASEAGKSYVAEAIDYMLGSATLRDVPEAAPFSQLLLGLDIDGYVITLARAIRNGSRISVHEGDIRSFDLGTPSVILAAANATKVNDTVSNYLLEHLGLAGSRVRKNDRNDTVALGLRDVSRFAVIDEERMHSRTSPVQSGRPTTRTKELSVLKLLLQGHDDADLIGGDDPVAFRRLNRAQLGVLDRAINQVREQLFDAPSEEECEEGLRAVQRSIDLDTASIADHLSTQDGVASGLNKLRARRREHESRLREADLLLARFSLLETQYGRDLDRLATVKSAGTLLRYFDNDQCIYCGALAEDQHPAHAEYETEKLRDAIDAEMGQTEALRDDLRRTLSDLATQRDALQATTSATTSAIEVAEELVVNLETRTQPRRLALQELMVRKRDLEHWAENWRHVNELMALSRQVAQEQPTTSKSVAQVISYTVESEFSSRLSSVLSAWNVPDGDKASFVSTPQPEMFIGGRPRSARGEGMRSVLHAAFGVALAEYCEEHELPHPGFLVLDTPMLTYRDPEIGANNAPQHDATEAAADGASDHLTTIGEDVMPATVSRAFYAYLTTSGLQTVVLENQTPPDVDDEVSTVVYFSGSSEVGRQGFYPAITSP